MWLLGRDGVSFKSQEDRYAYILQYDGSDPVR